jgi:hypothetical protein
MMSQTNPIPEFDLDAWAQRLEAGRTDDPELELAKKLTFSNEAPTRPAGDFRRDRASGC